MRSFDEAESRLKKSYIADCEKTQAPIPENEYNLCSGVGQASRPYSSEEIVGEMFKYHPPNEQTIPKYSAINQAAKNFAEVVLANCPQDRTETQQSTAFVKRVWWLMPPLP